MLSIGLGHPLLPPLPHSKFSHPESEALSTGGQCVNDRENESTQLSDVHLFIKTPRRIRPDYHRDPIRDPAARYAFNLFVVRMIWWRRRINPPTPPLYFPPRNRWAR